MKARIPLGAARAPTAAEDLLVFGLEYPAPERPLYSNVNFASGYCFHPAAPVERIRLYLNGQYQDEAILGYPRLDVSEKYRIYGSYSLLSGFQCFFDSASIVRGDNRFEFEIDVRGKLTRVPRILHWAETGTLIYLRDGELYCVAARYGFSPEFQEYLADHPIPPGPGTAVGRTAVEGRVVHIPDVLADPDYTYREAQKISGHRAILGVPLLREGSCVGVMAMTRTVPQPFTKKQIELVTTFADQAVIAIENVRLFEEVQTRTRQLSQSVEELRALGEVSQAVNSTLDLEAVLTTIVAKAVELSGTEAGAIYTFDESHQEFCCARPMAWTRR